jgi:hypothetical protein
MLKMDTFLQANPSLAFLMRTKKNKTKMMSGLLHPAAEAISEVVLYPVFDAERLLHTDSARHHFTQKISRYANLEGVVYQELYAKTLAQFAECVQALPSQQGSKPGSLLDHSIERATAALRSYRQVTSAKASAGGSSDFSDICAYTLFTAALFQDIGKVISQQVVMISDIDGKHIKEWNPFEGSLLAVKAHHYKCRTLDDRWIALGKAASPLLAEKNMSTFGFEWIASDPKMLALWIAILTGDDEREKELLQFMQLPYHWFRDIPIQDHLVDLEFDATRPLQTALAEEFLAWLKKQLESERLLANTEKAEVHGLADGGLLIGAELLKKYCNEKNIGVTVLSRQLHALGLTEAGQDGNTFKKFSTSPEGAAQGNIARAPTALGGFFNAGGVTGAVAMASLIQLQGIVISRPELIMQTPLAPSAVSLTSVSPSPPPAQSIATVQHKIESAMQTQGPAAKSFLK